MRSRSGTWRKCWNQQAAGGVLTAKQAPHRPADPRHRVAGAPSRRSVCAPGRVFPCPADRKRIVMNASVSVRRIALMAVLAVLVLSGLARPLRAAANASFTFAGTVTFVEAIPAYHVFAWEG